MNKHFKFIFGSLITIIILYFLLKDIPFNTFIVLAEKITVQVLFITFFTYLLMNLARAMRIKKIFPSIKFSKLANIVFIHNMINNILPFRIGEFSYIYMIKKEKSSSQAISSLMILRITDLIGVFLIFSCSLLFIPLNDTITKLFGYILLIVIASVVFIFGFAKINLLKFKIIKDVRQSLKKYTPRKISLLTVDSLIIWVLSFLFYYFFIIALGIELSFFQVVVAAVLIIFSTILPISGIGGFGTTELAWTIGLMIFGVEKNIAIMSGLLIHVIKIVMFVIIGLFGLASSYYSSKTA
ncbi:flippase-like domain-containing protein [Candidatus Woesearchaeota archaeon]|nr:flippase-like domain-containing protein [Candidatus Woesearchaeota archaeon]